MDIGNTALRPKQGGIPNFREPLTGPPTASLRRPHDQSDLFTSSHHPFLDYAPDMVLTPFPGTGLFPQSIFLEKIITASMCTRGQTLAIQGGSRQNWDLPAGSQVCKAPHSTDPEPGWGGKSTRPQARASICTLASAPWRADKGLEMDQQVCPTPQSQAHPPCMSHLPLPHGEPAVGKLRNKMYGL